MQNPVMLRRIEKLQEQLAAVTASENPSEEDKARIEAQINEV